jgi:hypothetical protein
LTEQTFIKNIVTFLKNVGRSLKRRKMLSNISKNAATFKNVDKKLLMKSTFLINVGTFMLEEASRKMLEEASRKMLTKNMLEHL